MKKPIGYAVIRSRSFGGGYYEVLEVTTRKGRQTYGRDSHLAATHVADRDVLRMCDTREQADFILATAAAIRVKHRPTIEAARRVLSTAQHAERVELENLVKGELP